MVKGSGIERPPGVVGLRVVPGLRTVVGMPDDPRLDAVPVRPEPFGRDVERAGGSSGAHRGRGGGRGGGRSRGRRSRGGAGARGGASAPALGPGRGAERAGLRHHGGRAAVVVQAIVHHGPPGGPGGVAGCGRWRSGHVAQRAADRPDIIDIVGVQRGGGGRARHGVADRDDGDGGGAAAVSVVLRVKRMRAGFSGVACVCGTAGSSGAAHGKMSKRTPHLSRTVT